MLPEIPIPKEGERPTIFADRIGMWYVTQKSQKHRKEYGLYLTPVIVAEFMAEKIKANGSTLRVLDPAAGSGILCCAAVERLVSRNPNTIAIELVTYEVDKILASYLRVVLNYLVEWCKNNYGVKISVRVETTDFILAHAEVLQFQGELLPSRTANQEYNIVISNPPYFKLKKDDPRTAVATKIVYGQLNIYALFMAISAVLLCKRGDFVFIISRSFTSGVYFRQFREFFFKIIRPITVHVFGSRRDAFIRDDVLQENIIVSGKREDFWNQTRTEPRLIISSSHGLLDICGPVSLDVSINVAINLKSDDKVLRLPMCTKDEDVLAFVDSWPCSLFDLGLKISTGPVVPFRATTLIGNEGKVPLSHVPLLWMNHVREMKTTWPLNRHKPEYIQRSGAETLLIPNKNYVLLRRFSSKEQPRRLTAAPYVSNAFEAPEVGLENHLNYIHRPGGQLSDDETLGLAALYNSHLLDTYFRTINGNTQVSATELRSIPLPAHEIIVALGQRMKNLDDPMQHLELHVMTLVGSSELRETFVGQS